jgi:hypothetical protein
MSLKPFSEWCTPETILVLARATDEPARVLSAMRHSGAGAARVLLAQLSTQPRGNMTASFRPRRVLPWPANREFAPSSVPIDRAVTWSEVASQCFFISSVSLHDLPTLVRAFRIGRVVLTAGAGSEPADGKSIEEMLLETLDVPLWIVGPNVRPRSDANPQVERILFPIVFAPGLQDSLQFACQYTRVRRGKLTLLHIFDMRGAGCAPEDRTPFAIQSRLPLKPLFRSGPPCAMDVAVRQGEFGQELVHFNEQRPHDVILMDGFPSGPAIRQVLFQAACPVFMFRAANPVSAERLQCIEASSTEMPNCKAM